MKKFLFLSVAAVAALTTACSNENVIDEPQPMGIQFDGAFVNKATRHGGITDQNFTSFTVYGYLNNNGVESMPFNGVNVTREENATTWSYTPLRYWTAGSKYYWQAISGTAAGSNWTWEAPSEQPNDRTAVPFGSLTFNVTDGSQDLVVANAYSETDASITATPAAVQLDFKHILSRIGFQFTSAMTEDYTFTISDLQINDAATSGTTKLSTIDWNVGTSTKVITIPASSHLYGVGDIVGPTATGDKATKFDNYVFLLPKNGINVTFTLTMNFQGVKMGTFQHEVTLPGSQVFAPGQSYLLAAEINPDNFDPATPESYPIKFTATVEAWAEDNNVDLVEPEEEETPSA